MMVHNDAVVSEFVSCQYPETWLLCFKICFAIGQPLKQIINLAPALRDMTFANKSAKCHRMSPFETYVVAGLVVIMNRHLVLSLT